MRARPVHGGGTPLFDALFAAGIPAPYSCREGACSACCCRVVTYG
ncbi:2Fe-2S iron-sulfur cluster-binding protein [Streptomyces nojiriensis]